jgi:hypothetical protein
MLDISKISKMILAIALATLLMALGTDRAMNPVVTGDGSEYIAQSLAITRGEGVYIQPKTKSWAAYTMLYDSGEIPVSPASLSKAFKHLCRTGRGACDYNHFWLYSLVASLTGGVLLGLKAHLAPYWFSLANLLILTSSCLFTHSIASPKEENTRKAPAKINEEWISVLSFIFLSGILWWISLAHTEVFSFSLIMPASMLLTKRRYLECALLMAVASTQNYFWAPAAVGLLVIGYSGKRIDQLNPIQWTGRSLSVGLVSIAILALHPTYYWLNYGLLTPQQGLGIEKGIKTLPATLNFLIDPSNGITWYTLGIWSVIGLGAVITSASLLGSNGKSRRQNLRDFTPYYILCATIIYTLLACSQTSNFNHGATYGPSRYGLMIIALCYPFYRACLIYVLSTKEALITLVAGSTFSFLLTSNAPWDLDKPESYTSRTRLDLALPNQLQIMLREPETLIERSFSKEGYPKINGPFTLFSHSGENAMVLAIHREEAQKLEQLLNEGKRLDIVTTSGRRACPQPEVPKQLPVSFFLWGRSLIPNHNPREAGAGIWTAIIDNSRIKHNNRIEGYAFSSPDSFHGVEEWGRWAAKHEVDITIPAGARQILVSTSGVFNSTSKIQLDWQKEGLLGNYKSFDRIILAPSATTLLSIPKDARRLLVKANGGGYPRSLNKLSRDRRYLTIGFKKLVFICGQTGKTT